MPFTQHTWLGPGHTVPHGNRPTPYAENTPFCCALLLPALTPVRQLFELPIDGTKTIYFYLLVMLYREEMDFLLKHGHDAFLERYDAQHLPGWIDNTRPNLCPKTGLWPWRKR